ncbi:hypothetical protein DN752_05695 [Echinicola strongylocentroti]|uniref:Uncharacterized protein n=1 Tax=Echinicola strongylocentroti TaxID=1795355 RepID=A0A2Z4IGU0_9BACT|nr:hypothetical protein [Echinicola strongylocentroti]AWW29653.1 hypothetical protein DN752_05695 [Echinicola strongylocentroti]
MKFILWLAVYIIVTLLCGPWLTYWMMMLVWAVLGAVIGGKGAKVFFAAALGVGLTWLGMSYWITVHTASALPGQMAEIMGMGSAELMMLVTAFLGMVIGGFSALTGNRFRKLFERKSVYYFDR